MASSLENSFVLWQILSTFTALLCKDNGAEYIDRKTNAMIRQRIKSFLNLGIIFYRSSQIGFTRVEIIYRFLICLKKYYINLYLQRQSREYLGTSQVVQWLRIRLPVQGTWVQTLVWEDSTCCGAAKPMCHNYWACTLKPASHNYWARMPQLLKPTCLEPMLLNKRSHHTATKSSPCSPQLGKSPRAEMKTQCSQK